MEIIYQTLFKSWKTTITTIVSAAVFLAAKFGYDVPSDVQIGIIAVSVWVIGFFSKDADKSHLDK